MNKKTLEQIRSNTRSSIRSCVENIRDIANAMLDEEVVEESNFQYLHYMLEGEAKSVSDHLSTLNTTRSIDISTKEDSQVTTTEEEEIVETEENLEMELEEEEEPEPNEEEVEIGQLQKERGKELVELYDDVTVEDKKQIRDNLLEADTQEDVDQVFHLLKRELENKYGDTSPSNERRTSETENNFERLFGNMLDDE